MPTAMSTMALFLAMSVMTSFVKVFFRLWIRGLGGWGLVTFLLERREFGHGGLLGVHVASCFSGPPKDRLMQAPGRLHAEEKLARMRTRW